MSTGENMSGRTMQITTNKGLCFYPYSKRKGQGFSVAQIIKKITKIQEITKWQGSKKTLMV